MIVTGDFETYYGQAYSLRNLSTAEYILDSRFQTIMLALKVNDGPSEVFIGHDAIAKRLSAVDWDNTAWLSHNTNFDGSILAWRYGYAPALYLDTLSMARATTHWVLGRSSLEKVSEYLGLPPKGHEVTKAMGKRLEDFLTGPLGELASYVEYCRRDNDNCYEIFKRLRPVFPNTELRLIDLICRMFIQPQTLLNPTVLAEHLNQVKAEKQQILNQVAHVDKSVFSSNQKFAALLESYGVEVPRKISPTTGDETYALAKNDRVFKELCQDDSLSLEVQALLAARLGVKSTLEETRTEKLLQHSLRSWHADGVRNRAATGVCSRSRGWAAVPLKYYGARTGRLSGDGGENWQNFKRGSRIREAVVAPEGYRIAHRDASQIEARMVAWLAGCQHLMQAFAQGRDVYSEFASTVYQRPITKADTKERFVGKTGILGLGYGCGGPKFRHMLFIGNGGISVNVSEEEAQRIVWHYRSTYPEIKDLWERCGWLLQQVSSLNRPLPPGKASHTPDISARQGIPVKVGFDALWLPNGMCIAYPRLRLERMPDNSFAMVYDDPYGGWRKIYGAKCTENISQALARIIVTDIAVRIYDLTGYHPFLSTHDSLDYCVPESEVEWMDQELTRQFAIVPAWAEGLPLASEGGWGKTLLAAEKKENG